MISRYNSTCPHCGNPIRKDVDSIVKKLGRWGHAICPRESGQPQVSKVFEAIIAKTEESDLSPEIATDKTTFTPSRYQQGVFDFITGGTGHAVVNAVAGSGKTTTIVQALKLTSAESKVAFVAFNKHIAEELKKRSPSHVKVCTLHSLGLSNLRQLGRVRVDEYKVDNILDAILPVDRNAPSEEKGAVYATRNNLKKLVSLVKATLCDHRDPVAVQVTADRYGLELNGDSDTVIGLLPKVIDLCARDTATVDFDDLIWIPIYLNLTLEKFDWLFVDEAQDLNKSQIELVLRSVSATGRIVAVGDPSQSLYGFRGADTQAI